MKNIVIIRACVTKTERLVGGWMLVGVFMKLSEVNYEYNKRSLKKIDSILKKYKIPYTTHWESRDVQKAIGCPDVTVHDKHIQFKLVIPVKLVIPDYFEEEQRWYCGKLL